MSENASSSVLPALSKEETLSVGGVISLFAVEFLLIADGAFGRCV